MKLCSCVHERLLPFEVAFRFHFLFHGALAAFLLEENDHKRFLINVKCSGSFLGVSYTVRKTTLFWGM